jgi:hypothetical protein
MGELCVEGLAAHGGPGSCAGDPRGRGEALTQRHVQAGLLSREITIPGARTVHNVEGALPAALPRAAGGPRAVGEPGHVRNLHAREPGEPVLARPLDQRAGRSGNARAVILG